VTENRPVEEKPKCTFVYCWGYECATQIYDVRFGYYYCQTQIM